jgi:hypothetical protein
MLMPRFAEINRPSRNVEQFTVANRAADGSNETVGDFSRQDFQLNVTR